MADDSSRPLRDTIEQGLERVPHGPLNFGGGGNVVGAGGLIAAQVAKTLIPGEELDPGYRVRSHQVKRTGGTERHTFEIDAYSKNVAEVVARLRSAPSNLDFLRERPQVTNTVKVRERSTATTWRITVQLKDRNTTRHV